MLTEDSAKKLKSSGAAIVGLGLLVLYGMVGTIESDCYYFWQLLGQYRYCDEKYVGEEQALNYVHLVGTILFLTLGIALYRKGAKVIRYYENKKKREE
ncbi:MAG: hypothetical protein ABW098_12770 [Candidatus Thiodiazotropha sp.]